MTAATKPRTRNKSGRLRKKYTHKDGHKTQRKLYRPAFDDEFAPFIPSPEQIKASAALIRQKWSEGETAKRVVGTNRTKPDEADWTPPTFSLSHLGMFPEETPI